MLPGVPCMPKAEAAGGDELLKPIAMSGERQKLEFFDMDMGDLDGKEDKRRSYDDSHLWLQDLPVEVGTETARGCLTSRADWCRLQCAATSLQAPAKAAWTRPFNCAEATAKVNTVLKRTLTAAFFGWKALSSEAQLLRAAVESSLARRQSAWQLRLIAAWGDLARGRRSDGNKLADDAASWRRKVLLRIVWRGLMLVVKAWSFAQGKVGDTVKQWRDVCLGNVFKAWRTYKGRETPWEILQKLLDMKARSPPGVWTPRDEATLSCALEICLGKG